MQVKTFVAVKRGEVKDNKMTIQGYLRDIKISLRRRGRKAKAII